MQSRNEALLRAMIDGTGKGDLKPPQSRIEALLYELMDKIDQGGGGGGSGGGLVVHHQNSVLDKTWQEIHDAVASGSGAVVILDTDCCYQVMYCGYDTDLQAYIVFCSDSAGLVNFRAESQSGYPRV